MADKYFGNYEEVDAIDDSDIFVTGTATGTKKSTFAKIYQGFKNRFNVSDEKPTITETSSDTDIASGDTFSTILGKIRYTLSYFRTKINSHTTSINELNSNKVNKSGDTVTGNLQINGSLNANSGIQLVTEGGMWKSGKNATKCIVTTQQSEDSYYPILRTNTSSSHIVNIGGIGDNFGVYGFYSNNTDGNYANWSTYWNAPTGTLTHCGHLQINDGALNVGSCISTWTDIEGGNIQIKGGDDTLWEMDAYNGNFRIFNFTNTTYPGITINKDGSLKSNGIVFNNYANPLLLPLKEGTSTGNLRLTTMSDGSSFNIAYQKTTSSGWDYNYLSINPTNKKMTVGVSGYTVTYDGTPVFSGTPNFASNTVTFNSGANINNPSPQQLIIGATSENNYKVFLGVRDSAWRFCPNKDNLLDLGAPNYRWQKIYCSSSAISTSDRNQKKDIYDLNDKYIELFMKLQPVSYKFIDGTSGRTHVGFISQDVEEAMFECGLTDLDFAGFCRDPKTEIVETEIDGEIVREERVIEGEYLYSLRYEEFIALNTAVIQYNRKRITDLENKLNKIAEMLNIDLSEI